MNPGAAYRKETLPRYRRLGLDGIMAQKSEDTFFTLNKEIKLTSSWQVAWAILSHKNGFPSSVFPGLLLIFLAGRSMPMNTQETLTQGDNFFLPGTMPCLSDVTVTAPPQSQLQTAGGYLEHRKECAGLRRGTLQRPAIPAGQELGKTLRAFYTRQIAASLS